MITARSDSGGGSLCDRSVHNVIEDYSHKHLGFRTQVFKATCLRSEQVKKVLKNFDIIEDDCSRVKT